MAFTFNPLTGALDIVGTSGGGGPAPTVAPRFTQTVNNNTHWGTASGGLYTIVILASTHGKGLKPTVTMFEQVGSDYEQVTVNYNINSSGDVSISVPDSPDLRFAGVVVII